MRPKTFSLLSATLTAVLHLGVAQAQAGAANTPAGAPATATAQPAAVKADPRAAIVKKLGGIRLEDVRMSPVSGIYEVTRDAEISYLSADGRYAILGDMIDLDSDDNVSESRRRNIRARIIETVPESEMLVFSPKDPKYTITVFTDIPDRRVQPARHSRAVPVFPAFRSRYRVLAQGRVGLVRGEPQRCAHAREERRNDQIAEVPHAHHPARFRSRPEAGGRWHPGHLPVERGNAGRLCAAGPAREVSEIGKDVRAPRAAARPSGL
jgi:hypothetical protein